MIPGLGIRSFIFYAETKDPASHNEVLAWPPPQKKLDVDHWSWAMGTVYAVTQECPAL